MRHSKALRSALAAIVAATMAFTLAFSPALASADDATGSYAAGATPTLGTPEWAIDDGDAQTASFSTQAGFPATYDLRTEDLVTPVKFQNPWGSCWAFGGTAAAETSLLSAYGSTYKASGLDLSERHLTYFALQPITENVDPKQAGEGMHTLDDSANAAFDAGGLPILITSLFSQGVGPMPEALFPYRGVGEDGKTHTTLEYFNLHPEVVAKDQMTTEAAQQGMTYDQYIAYIKERSGKSEDEIIEMVVERLKTILPTLPLTYSKFDDWSIPEMNDDGASNRMLSAGVVLKNGNVLPAYWNEDKTAIADASKTAIKQELLNGHGVSIKYFADQSGKYTNEAPGATGKSTQYGQYVFDGLGQNHGVCIVGWDDNYPADNFYHKVMVKQPDGTEVEDTEATAKTKPENNGAWIVKNSWGSDTDATVDDLGNTINKGSFGNKNAEGATTGYFYLSYYDKTINQPETMEFSADLGTSGGFYAIQYDYSPAYGGFYSSPKSSDVISSANVFTAEDAIEIKSVSTRTDETNMRVTFAIYEMNDNAKDPTDGAMLYRTSQNFEYGGFHRLDLERPITIAQGKKYSVVSTASTLDNEGKRSYNVTAGRTLSKKAAEQLIAKGQKMKSYGTTVVNEGESFLYDGKKWQDWSSYIATLPVDPKVHEDMTGDSYIDLTPIDNFSIKVYAEQADANLTSFAGSTVAAGFSDLNLNEWYMQTEGGAFPDTKTLYLDYTVAKGLMSGYADGSKRFGPNDSLSRAQAATIVYRMANKDASATTDPSKYEENKSGLPDVEDKAYYTAAVNWAVEAGVITGYKEGPNAGKFCPNDPVSREQLAAIIGRLKDPDAKAGDDVSGFKDADSISDFAKAGIAYCNANGIMTGVGTSGNFDPKGLATRAQMSKVVAVADRLK